MLVLTKLDGTPIMVSLASVKYLEEVPDTLIFFLNGDSVMVQESFSEILSKYNQVSEDTHTNV